MIKDINIGNLIIPTSDPRYGKLGHVWNKYSWNNITRHFEGHESTYYYIPKELVIHRYETIHLGVSNKDEWPTWEYSNWVSNRVFTKIIYKITELTPQEFFDIVVLHNNNRLDRPRCGHCKRFLIFSNRFSHGYTADVEGWLWHIKSYCSNSCRTREMDSDANSYAAFHIAKEENIKYLVDIRANIKSVMTQFINAGSPNDEACFYLAILSNGRVKLGASTNVDFRSYNWGDCYLTYHTILISNRINIAYFEAKIKLELESAKEDFEFSKLSNIIKLIKAYIKLFPINNPFISD